MVVAGHPEVAELGIAVLRQGGNAMDAAVTVSFALGVAEPYGSGLGGKLMMLYYDAADDRVLAIDAMDEASASLDVERFRARSPQERTEGWGGVAIPGLVAGMYEAHRRWGRLPWAEAVQPAADLARTGSVVLPRARALFEHRLERIRVSDETSRVFLPGGQLPDAGSRLANPDLARTLETVARDGREGFYGGWVAAAVAGASRQGGGSLTLQDLSGYEARVTEPLAGEHHGFTVLTGPPPATGGATVLLALARLAEASWSGAELAHPDNLDRIGRVLEQGYPEIQAGIADVPAARESFRQLVSDESTTHFVVVDADGNAASVTQSLSHHFGAGVVAPGTGVVFNNSLKNFTTRDESSVNFVAPSKRPRSTIAPTLVLRDGVPVLALGLPGGQRIPTATLQVLLDYMVFDADLADAIRRPRFHLRRPLRRDEPTNVFQMEAAGAPLAAALREKGWEVEVNENAETFGGFCAIEILPDGTRVGVADLRRTNAARGY